MFKVFKDVRALPITLIFSALIFLFGCVDRSSEDTESTKGKDSGEQVTLQWASGDLGSSAQMLVSAISSVSNDIEEDLYLSAMTTGGSVENPRLLRDQVIDLAHTTDAYWAYKAEGAFEGEEPVDLLSLFTMYANLHVFAVLEDSPIQSIEDLAGKKVHIAPPGSGAAGLSRAMLEVYDLWEGENAVEKYELGWGEAADALRDGTIDAMITFFSGDIPFPTLEELLTTDNLRFLQIEESKVAEANELYPGYGPVTVLAENVEGLDENIYGLANFSMEYSDSRLSTDHAYKIVKNTFENVEKLKGYHRLAENLILEDALLGMPKDIPVHPGAVKYYEEKGVWDNWKDEYTVGEVD